MTDKMLMVKIWRKGWSGEVSDILTFPASFLPLPTKKTWSILYHHYLISVTTVYLLLDIQRIYKSFILLQK